VAARAEGNPLFAEEMGAACQSRSASAAELRDRQALLAPALIRSTLPAPLLAHAAVIAGRSGGGADAIAEARWRSGGRYGRCATKDIVVARGSGLAGEQSSRSSTR